MKTIVSTLFIIILASCSNSNYTLDETAERLVKFTHSLGKIDMDLVDAYYGPDSLKEQALNISSYDIKDSLVQLIEDIENIETDEENGILHLRKKYQLAIVNSLKTRADIINGEELKFLNECKLIFDYEPKLESEKYFESIIDSLNKILPGAGNIRERFNLLSSQFILDPEKTDTIFKDALNHSREITSKYIELPENEKIKLEYVYDKPWSGYNWYQGNANSLVQINLSHPIHVERALDLSSHEAYPGHHTFHSQFEKIYYRDSNFVEFSIYPLFSPISFLSEGSAEYGIDLVYNGDEKFDYIFNQIYKGNDVSKSDLRIYLKSLMLFEELDKAVVKAAQMYLDGEFDENETIQYIMDYSLESKSRANQRLEFIKKYRAYIINYSYGKQLVRNFIDKKAGNEGIERKWLIYRDIISHPYSASDLN